LIAAGGIFPINDHAPTAKEIFAYRDENQGVNTMPWGFDHGGVSDDSRINWVSLSCTGLSGNKDKLTISALKNVMEKMQELLIEPKWIPLKKARDTAINKPGIYMFAFDKPVKYDNEASRIVYIGSGVKLKNRLSQHYNDFKPYFLKYVTKGDMEEVFCCFQYFEVESQDELLEIEQSFLDSFVIKCGSIPLSNWMPKTSGIMSVEVPAKAFLETNKLNLLFKFKENLSGQHPLTFDEISEIYDLEYERDEWSPRIMFHQKGTFEKWEKRKKEWEVEKYTHIRWNNIICWEKNKFIELLRIAKNLKEDKTKKLKVTRRFQSNTSQTPRPHTWGEVAVALARYLSGTWFYKNTLRVEIKHKKELLGRSIIRKSGCNGNDIANIPQINKVRALSYRYDQFEDIDKKAEELAWEYHEQGKELPKNAIGRIVEWEDSFSYHKFDWVDELREKEEKERAERIFKEALTEVEGF